MIYLESLDIQNRERLRISLSYPDEYSWCLMDFDIEQFVRINSRVVLST